MSKIKSALPNCFHTPLVTSEDDGSRFRSSLSFYGNRVTPEFYQISDQMCGTHDFYEFPNGCNCIGFHINM